MPKVIELSPGPQPILLQDMGRLGVLGAAGDEQLLLRSAADVPSAGLPPGELAASLTGFFALRGREALLVPADHIPNADCGLLVLADPAASREAIGSAHALAQQMGAMLLIDPPADRTTPESWRAWLGSIRADWPDAALFAPALRAEDGAALRPAIIAAALLARSERERGIWKSPAGLDADIASIAPARPVRDAEQQLLNPEGINLYRSFAGRGSFLWGARTLSRDPEWRYLSVRRLHRMLLRSLERGLAWVVFEPNTENLWQTLSATVDDLFHRLWRLGAFAGTSPATSYFVRCDASTTTAADQQAGRVILQFGYAPLKPGEFLSARIALNTAAQ